MVFREHARDRHKHNKIINSVDDLFGSVMVDSMAGRFVLRVNQHCCYMRFGPLSLTASAYAVHVPNLNVFEHVRRKYVVFI